MRLTQIPEGTIQNKRTITLRRDGDSGVPSIELTLHALPPDHGEEAEAEIPSPTPPWRGEFLRDKKGRFEKDDAGRPIKVYDDEDERYRKALDRVNQLQATKMIVDALDSGEIQFDAQKDSRTPAEYYAAVRREMGEFGFSLGDFTTLLEQITDVSGLDIKALRLARTDFFEAENSRSATSSTKSSAPSAGRIADGVPNPESSADAG